MLTLLIGISCGMHRGAAPEQLGRPGGDDVRPDRRVAAEFLARADDDRAVLSVQLGWLPTGGYVPFSRQTSWAGFRTATMPAISLALLQIGLLARITRSTMLEVLRQDYIRTARAKGLPECIVIGKHAFSNVMIPVSR